MVSHFFLVVRKLHCFNFYYSINENLFEGKMLFECGL